MDKFIVNPVQLKFDPLDDNTNIKVKQVFQDKLARTLWIAIRQRGYLTNQYFEHHCFNASKHFENFGIPESIQRLKLTLENHFNLTYEHEFLEELLPYLTGEKNLEYEVVK